MPPRPKAREKSCDSRPNARPKRLRDVSSENRKKSDPFSPKIPNCFPKQHERRKDYASLFSFLIFVGFYMSILFLQRSANEAYELTSTLKNNLIPEDTTMKGSAEVRDWIASVVTTTWQDARCGDGRCEGKYFPFTKSQHCLPIRD